MLNKDTKQMDQLQQRSIVGLHQNLHVPSTFTGTHFQQIKEQRAYLLQMQFVCAMADVWHIERQAQPKLQLYVYRQFIRVLLGKRHVILAESEQLNTYSLYGTAFRINQSFWMHIRTGVIQ